MEQFSELDVHKCLLSYGFFPMLLILREKELKEEYLICAKIKNAIISFKENHPFLGEEYKTKYTEEIEKEYYSYFKRLTFEGELLAKKNIVYYLKDIKQRLNI
jgi:hypothetical protein